MMRQGAHLPSQTPPPPPRQFLAPPSTPRSSLLLPGAGEACLTSPPSTHTPSYAALTAPPPTLRSPQRTLLPSPPRGPHVTAVTPAARIGAAVSKHPALPGASPSRQAAVSDDDFAAPAARQKHERQREERGGEGEEHHHHFNDHREDEEEEDHDASEGRAARVAPLSSADDESADGRSAAVAGDARGCGVRRAARASAAYSEHPVCAAATESVAGWATARGATGGSTACTRRRINVRYRFQAGRRNGWCTRYQRRSRSGLGP